MTAPFVVERLAAGHDRADFTCGAEALDRYLQHQASQDERRRITACFVALDATNGRIAGYYALAASGIPLAEMPEALAKRLPRYPSVPVARLGCLAVALTYRGRRLGGALLWDAVDRAARSDVAVYALVVDAKDEEAEKFYQHHGFAAFGSAPGTLILPLKPVRRS
jgi:GNAT superfamily N-acetyltransferase